MSDEIVLNEKTYVSSKKAAEATGYARDYIGQLSRGGHIDAERVGGLWYVSMESLQNYEKNAELAKANAPLSAGSKEAESILSFEGKDYISASRASKLTGYNQDYIGQLARGGKIPSRQIGNRWYVDRDALVAHKKEKDALLAAVQAETVGLKTSHASLYAAPKKEKALSPMQYTAESSDLIPKISLKSEEISPVATNFDEIRPREARVNEIQPIQTAPVVQNPPIRPPIVPLHPRKSNKTRNVALSGAVLTIVLVAAVGFTTLNRSDTLASEESGGKMQAMTASAGAAVNKIGDIIEDWVSPELIYIREG